MSSPQNPIYEIFAGKALADLAPAASAIGLAEQTVRDLIWLGNFPVKTVKIGRKRLVVVADLARYYAELVGLTDTADEPAAAAPAEPTETTPRRRGRPTKVEQAARARTRAAELKLKGGAQ